MAHLKWIVLAVCSLWAMGGLIVMLGYGAGGSPISIGLTALLNFGPLALGLAWVVAPRRGQ